MSFVHPLGLLGLLGIPILIIVYIIKSKYTEQTVSSTYLWTLSERFLKRKNPISRVTGIISLVLQLLTVLLVSLAISQPVFILKGSAEEYCFVLDASGSMAYTKGEGSRFDAAKSEIEKIIDESAQGSIYTLVRVDGTASTVFEKTSDKTKAVELLSSLEVGYTEFDAEDALLSAQEYFSLNPAANVYLVTDTGYATANNVKVVNVTSNTKNFGISGLTFDFVDGSLQISGKVKSYGSAATVTLELYADGDFSEPVATQLVLANAYLDTDFYFFALPMRDFSSMTVKVANEDGLTLDNSATLYNPKADKAYKTLLVSDNPFFIESAFTSLGFTSIETLPTAEYTERSGYGLYIFDGFNPAAVPTDGSVWFINPSASIESSGFSVRGEVPLATGEKLELTTSTSTAARTLTEGVSGENIFVKRYVKCSMYSGFTTLLSYNQNPVLFAGTNGYGNRQAVFGFDLHDSDIVLNQDFLRILYNLIYYSFPDVLEGVTYTAGDEVKINYPANCESVRIDAPSGESLYLEPHGSGVGAFVVDEVGEYTLTVVSSGRSVEYKLFSGLAESERMPITAGVDFSIQGEKQDGGFDGVYKDITYVFIILAVIFTADWMVYCYEKYQLR